MRTLRMAISLALWLALALTASGGEVLDRIVANVGTDVVLESDVLRHIRLRSFQNLQRADFGPESRQEAAQQLVNRMLLEREMTQSRATAPDGKVTDAALAQIREQRGPAYRSQLSLYGITEEQLRDFVARQVAADRFIDARFAPGIQLTDAEVEEHYRAEVVPALQARNQPVTPLAEVRAQVEASLLERRVDAALERWLGDARIQTPIRFRDEALRGAAKEEVKQR